MIKNLSINNSTNYKLSKRDIHKIVGLLKKELKFSISFLEITFVNEKLIIDINKKYLNHNYNTDIIAFNYSEENFILDGEIFISLDDAYSNSHRFKTTLNKEIIRLVSHGILHLLGYNDIENDDRKKMKKVENYLVKKFSELFIREIVIYDSKNC